MPIHLKILDFFQLKSDLMCRAHSASNAFSGFRFFNIGIVAHFEQFDIYVPFSIIGQKIIPDFIPIPLSTLEKIEIYLTIYG